MCPRASGIRFFIQGWVVGMGRVLVVDDDRDTAEAMRQLLTRSGHEAAAVCDGTEALQWLAGHSPPPDVVVLDWMMPMVGGADVLRAIRSDPAYRRTRVMIYSGADERGLERTAQTLGASAYVAKGAVEWDDLLGRIEALMARPDDETGGANAATTKQAS